MTEVDLQSLIRQMLEYGVSETVAEKKIRDYFITHRSPFTAAMVGQIRQTYGQHLSVGYTMPAPPKPKKKKKKGKR